VVGKTIFPFILEICIMIKINQRQISRQWYLECLEENPFYLFYHNETYVVTYAAAPVLFLQIPAISYIEYWSVQFVSARWSYG
jgi:hypothetical protein